MMNGGREQYMRLSIIFIGHDSRAFLDEQRSYREAFAGPGVDIDVRSIKGGPETLERELDEVQAGPWIIEEAVAAEKEGADALVIGCTGLSPVFPRFKRELQVPVMDPVAAGIHLASALVESDRH